MAGTEPFATGVRGFDEEAAGRARLRGTGPLVEVEAPAGGPVWVVTDEELARAVLTDPRIAKDTALAPDGWPAADLEPPAAAHPSLTTADGAAHTRLRQAHAPLLGRRRTAGHADRIAATARTLLWRAAANADTADGSAGVVDLMSDFTVRYPLTVILDLTGVPAEATEEAVAACRGMVAADAGERGMAFARLNTVALRALGPDGHPGIGTELRDRLGDDLTDTQIGYLLFGLIFAGQLTTDAALGFLLARALDPETDLTTASREQLDALVADVLAVHPPAPFTLWRFTSIPIELAGTPLPARAPVLVDIAGINADLRERRRHGQPVGPDLTFGHGPHFCAGAHLARQELRSALEVLRDDFPHARLAATPRELQQADLGDTGGSRLAALPVQLHGPEAPDPPR